MEFCPYCGTRLNLTRKEKEKTAFYFLCAKCGYERKTPNESYPTLKAAKKSTEESIVVIGEQEQKLRTLPTVRTECPKCENNLVYAWQVQTRGSDESSTQFFRCTKCNHTFRDYS